MLFNWAISFPWSSIGAVYNDRKASGVAGPNAGLKYFFDEQTFLNLGHRYEFFFSRFEAIDNHTSHGNHAANSASVLTGRAIARRAGNRSGTAVAVVVLCGEKKFCAIERR